MKPTSILPLLYNPSPLRCVHFDFATRKLDVHHLWPPADLVLKAEMLLQLAPLTAVIIAELALVRLDLGVLLQVLLQGLVTGACEGAFVAAEHQTLKVA